MTFGSLFAGIGGFDLGLERAGMVCKWQVEIDDYAGRVLAKHWPNVSRWGDVRTFPPGTSDEWRVDVVCAGVPCQPVSHAGKQKGADDERWMWGEALRIVADLQPRFFVAENPIGILNHDGGRTFRGLMRALASVGYVCEWDVIAAAHIGAPHQRDRVWLVAHADSVSRLEGQSRRAAGELSEESAGSQGRQNQGEAGAVVGGGGATQVAVSTGVDTVPVLRRLPLHDSRYARSRLHLSADRRMDPRPIQASHDMADSDGQGLQGAVLEHTSEGLPRPRSGARRDEEQGLPDATPGWWETEPDVGRVAHGVSSRVDRLRCLGNAVVPQIVEIIGRAIIEATN
jgi:DNA (cytosine-5)-methyltransferase 1